MSDDWATPDWLLGCFPGFYDPSPLHGSGGLEVDWINMAESQKACGIWLNPPHSNPLPWVLKGIDAAKQGVRVVMLLRLDSTTRHHKALVEAGFHPFGAFERIRYGNSDHGGQYANVLWFSP